MENKTKPIISNIVYAVHHNASMILGWSLFHRLIYPVAYYVRRMDIDTGTALPIYVLNVLAFGCLVDVATRPLARLLAELLCTIDKALFD